MEEIVYVVTFENSKGIEREIGRAKTIQEANDIIHSFLDRHNCKSYYWRKWYIDESQTKMKIDVGSWTEFFYIFRNDLKSMEEELFLV